MHDVDLADTAVRQAATDLRRARRHADWLDRLAWASAALGLVIGLVLAAADLALVTTGLVVAFAGLVTWGVLRGLALLLHLRVDETMVHLADDDRDSQDAARA